MNRARIAAVSTIATLATFATVAALAFVLALPAAAADKKIEKKDVPAPVLAAFEKAWPTAKAVAYAQETEKGKTFYEIESKDGEMNRDILFSANGSIVEVEETVKEADLPAPVLATVKKMGTGVSIRKAEKETKGAVVTYSIKLKGAKVKEVSLDASGAPVKP